jgi:hypothetical protein
MRCHSQAVLFHILLDSCRDMWPGIVGMNHQLSSISWNVKSADFEKNVIDIVLACPLASSGQNLDHVESMRIPTQR